MPGSSKPPPPGASLGLAQLSPLAQLRAGGLRRRLPQLYLGLCLYGFAMALMIRSELGLDPWDVLHQGLTRYLPLSFGAVTALVGFLVLLAWWPLRQWPGLGTVSNVVVIGVSVDVALWLLPPVQGTLAQAAVLVVALVANGVAGAAYIGSQFGPGPRDGLMTGLALRTGRSLRLVRTVIEVSVLILGFALGGTVGIGTVVYAVTIGPLIQFFLRFLLVPLPNLPSPPAAGHRDPGPQSGSAAGRRSGDDAGSAREGPSEHGGDLDAATTLGPSS